MNIEEPWKAEKQPARSTNGKRMPDESAQVPEPVIDRSPTPIVKPGEHTEDPSSWLVAEIQNDKGSLHLRFNYGKRQIANDPSFSKMIVFETVAVETNDSDEYIANLDSLEDAVKERMEAIDGCVLLLTRTGAGFRDLLFACRGGEKGFDAPIRKLISDFPERMNVRVEEPDWHLFNALADQVDNVFATPREAILEYVRAVKVRDWDAATRCLGTRLRAAVEESLTDRSFFDQHLCKGFKRKGGEMIPVKSFSKDMMEHSLGNVECYSEKPEGFTFEYVVGGSDPYLSSYSPFLSIVNFVKEGKGWKIDCPYVKEPDDFRKWYNAKIPDRARGQARREEAERKQKTR